ncbi:hypothetical protein BJF77_11075 [Kocuria sp. CNJ-770]|uniref:hypothetical protein n=1 Tax=Kocuria sp. CNJ-770 TaxID=1904964 RepID=UPI0009657DDE|nr:hypothetical protein [Kocuria sp. CNJ-770]OLT09322.1 hypothetical protein BJF77_11075 [Kocuria sp. CNJ-770]
MSGTWGTYTLRWAETGDIETQPLTVALPLNRLEEVTTAAADEDMTPSEFLSGCFIGAGLDILAVDWRGPA